MAEQLTIIPLARTIRNGKVVHETNDTMTHRREKVEVANAPQRGRGIDGNLIRFSEEKVNYFLVKGQVPLEKIRYWLLRSNQLTVSRGEKSLDFPHAEQILGFLTAVGNQYTPDGNQALIAGVTPSDVEEVALTTIRVL